MCVQVQYRQKCIYEIDSITLPPAQGLLSHFRGKVVAAVPRENFTCLDLDSILNGVVYCVGWKEINQMTDTL